MDADSWRQAKSVLEAALLCAPAEREAFVAGRCADAWLRNEVLACLNEHDESFLESALTISNTFDNATSTEDAEPAPEVHPGERIAGRYEIVRRLGAGGMGAVFLAKDTDLERQVALKFLIAAASAADVRSRIFHEARAAARITHPHISVVHDVGVHEGRAFLVMEYVEGENLAQVLKRERPPLEQILAVGRQLASALAVAHEKGIIHRDLKPANIQIARDGSAKILDFGVAHAMASVDEPAGSSVTGVGTTLATLSTRTERGAIRHPGTPAYMSPEQMFGKPIDGRSDIYSLGVILYEMATGHRPYSTDDPLDVVLALSHKLLRPSGAETHLPEAVNDIIGKMLAVSLEERYQTASQAEAAIVALITPEVTPIRADDIGIWSRIPRLVRVAIGIALTPVILTALGFGTTATYNGELVRKAPFNAEPASVWLEMGLRSLVTPILVYVSPVVLAVWTARFGLRLLRLARPVDTLLTNSRTQSRRLWIKAGLADPVVLAQSIAAAGVVMLAVLLWICRDVFLAAVTIVPTFPDLTHRMQALRPGHNGYAHLYRFVLSNLAVALLFSTVRMSSLLSRQVNRRGVGALMAIVVLLVVVIALAELPYRLIGRNESERVMLSGERCYAIGQTADQLLLFCPDRNAPRNTVVAKDDPSVERTGALESIFTPRETTR